MLHYLEAFLDYSIDAFMTEQVGKQAGGKFKLSLHRALVPLSPSPNRADRREEDAYGVAVRTPTRGQPRTPSK